MSVKCSQINATAGQPSIAIAQGECAIRYHVGRLVAGFDKKLLRFVGKLRGWHHFNLRHDLTSQLARRTAEFLKSFREPDLWVGVGLKTWRNYRCLTPYLLPNLSTLLNSTRRAARVLVAHSPYKRSEGIRARVGFDSPSLRFRQVFLMVRLAARSKISRAHSATDLPDSDAARWISSH